MQLAPDKTVIVSAGEDIRQNRQSKNQVFYFWESQRKKADGFHHRLSQWIDFGPENLWLFDHVFHAEAFPFQGNGFCVM